MHFLNFRVNDTPVVHFYGVDCGGTESSFAECRFSDRKDFNCTRGFVSIQCCESKFDILKPYAIENIFRS